jgi:AcrR family transcriptional regulator
MILSMMREAGVWLGGRPNVLLAQHVRGVTSCQDRTFYLSTPKMERSIRYAVRMTTSQAGTRPSEARQRLLATATRIFYAEGIHAVGVDRLIAEAKVTRATFYRHFPGKEDLVLSYLREVHTMERATVETAIADNSEPVDALLAIARSIAQGIQSPGFRGCAFLNAAAEYPATDQPVHQEIIAHRQWFLDTLTTLMTKVHAETADPAARHFVMLRDGAMAAGCLFDPALVSETFLRGIEGLLRINAERQANASANK